MFGAFLGYAYAFAGHYGDDAYIQLQYARNLIDHHSWGFIAGHVANTATSPLNVAVEAVFGFVFGSVVRGTVWLTAVEFSLLCLLLVAISRRLLGSAFAGVVATVALAANPLLFSTIGLEGLLYTLGLVAALWLLLAGRWVWLAVVLGLVTLTRADGALLTAVFAVALALAWGRRRSTLGRLAGFGLVYLAVQLPWYWYSWHHLGGFLPDTLFLKQAQYAQPGLWGGWSYANGLIMFYRFDHAAVLGSFALAPLALLLFWRPGRELRRVAVVLAVYGLAHYLAYTALQVPPYHWYYLQQVVPALLLGALGAGSAARKLGASRPRLGASRPRLGTSGRRLGALGGTTVVVVALLVVPVHSLASDWNGPLPFSNWASPGRYAQIGRWVAAHTPPTATIELEGEAGTVGFYSQRSIVDDDGLTDLATANRLITAAARHQGPVWDWLLRLDMRYRPAPAPLPPASYGLVWARPLRGWRDLSPRPPGRIMHVWPIGSKSVPRAWVFLVKGHGTEAGSY